MWKKLNKRKEEKSVNFNPSDPNQVKRKLLRVFFMVIVQEIL